MRIKIACDALGTPRVHCNSCERPRGVPQLCSVCRNRAAIPHQCALCLRRCKAPRVNPNLRDKFKRQKDKI